MFSRAIEDLEEIEKCAFSDEILNSTQKLLTLLREQFPSNEFDDDSITQNFAPSSSLLGQDSIRTPSRNSVRLDRPILQRPDYEPPDPSTQPVKRISGDGKLIQNRSQLISSPSNNTHQDTNRNTSPQPIPPATPPADTLVNKRLSRSVSGNLRKSGPLKRQSQLNLIRTRSHNDTDAILKEEEEKKEQPQTPQINDPEPPAPRRPPRVCCFYLLNLKSIFS